MIRIYLNLFGWISFWLTKNILQNNWFYGKCESIQSMNYRFTFSKEVSDLYIKAIQLGVINKLGDYLDQYNIQNTKIKITFFVKCWKFINK